MTAHVEEDITDAILKTEAVDTVVPRPSVLRNPQREIFLADSHQALVDQEPARARVLMATFWLALVVMLGWAALTKVDEITKGEGRVIPSRQLQVLQSLDGGVVSEILVKEGQVVEAQQPLVTIDATRFDSSMQENRAQQLALTARISRLRALAEDRPFNAGEEVLKEAPRIAEAETRAYEAARATLSAQVSVAQQQLAQRERELEEAKARRVQAAQAYELTAKELAFTKPLLAAGAVSEVDLLRLERDVSRFAGERDVAAAQILRTQSAIVEVQRKIGEIQAAFRTDARKELADTMGKLNVSSAGGIGLQDRVAKSVLRSPVKGTVKRLLVATVGGVVQPGKDVIEIVPLEESLMLDARVQAKDIAFIRPGAKAMVKFTAYDFSIYGGLEAKVELIGADSITDDRGNTYYVVRLRTDKPQLGPKMPIIPGMLAEVDIMTGQKTILQYLLKPVLKARQAAMTER